MNTYKYSLYENFKALKNDNVLIEKNFDDKTHHVNFANDISNDSNDDMNVIEKIDLKKWNLKKDKIENEISDDEFKIKNKSKNKIRQIIEISSDNNDDDIEIKSKKIKMIKTMKKKIVEIFD